MTSFWHWILSTNPDAWAAAAGWTTTTIAGIAGGIAYKQVGEARRLREEQAQPYVVAYMEINPAADWIVDIVIKNFGSTVARDVRITSNVKIQRINNARRVEDVWFFDRLPVLVPGQEWRTVWDSSLRRHGSQLPDRHRVTVTYDDSRGHAMEPTEAELDWASHWNNLRVKSYGMHHAAEALRGMQKTFDKWSESGGGMRVFTRDGSVNDARDLKEFRTFQRRARLEEAREAATNQPEVDLPNEAGADAEASSTA